MGQAWQGRGSCEATAPKAPRLIHTARSGVGRYGKARSVSARFGVARKAREVLKWHRSPRAISFTGLGAAWRGRARMAGPGWYGLFRPGQVRRDKAREVFALKQFCSLQTVSFNEARRVLVRWVQVCSGMAWIGRVRYGEAWLVEARQDKERSIMPRRRQPKEIWAETRKRIWQRDGGTCAHCRVAVALAVCHVDHIQSGRHGSNADNNLRVLCRRCHVLRLDFRHRGMTAKALASGIIGPNWREEVWED